MPLLAILSISLWLVVICVGGWNYSYVLNRMNGHVPPMFRNELLLRCVMGWYVSTSSVPEQLRRRYLIWLWSVSASFACLGCLVWSLGQGSAATTFAAASVYTLVLTAIQWRRHRRLTAAAEALPRKDGAP